MYYEWAFIELFVEVRGTFHLLSCFWFIEISGNFLRHYQQQRGRTGRFIGDKKPFFFLFFNRRFLPSGCPYLCSFYLSPILKKDRKIVDVRQFVSRFSNCSSPQLSIFVAYKELWSVLMTKIYSIEVSFNTRTILNFMTTSLM